MTIAGVAGCMALLLVGFGLNDSIKSMTGNQFEKGVAFLPVPQV